MTSKLDDPHNGLPPASDAATLAPAAVAPLAHSETVTLPPSAEATAKETAGPVYVPGYQILRELGRGGMGVVYQARHVKLNRVVALKMILAGGHASEADLARFKTEGEAVARLQHPSIVQIFEVGEHAGRPFFSLEFCGGGGLDKKLAGTPLPPKEAAALVEKLARAMQAAHEKGVVHRDLKPANVLLTEDGTPKITDFGLAKKLDADAGQTRTGSVMGTPSYMAPEQAGGKTQETGPLCDVYALGAILYECLTGRPPFKAAATLDTMMQVVSDDPVPPRQLQSRTPRDLETICLKCLRKEAARRYPSATALAEDLRRWQTGEPIAARPVGRVERAVKWVRRRPAVASLMTLVLLVAAAGVAGILWKWHDALAAEQDAREAAGRERARAEGEADARLKAQQAGEQEKAAKEKAQQAGEQEKTAKEKALAERDEKERALIRAEGLRLAAEASVARRSDPALALLLAVEAVRRVPHHLTYAALFDAVGDCHELRTLTSHRDSVHFVRLSADGSRLLAVGDPDFAPDRARQASASARIYDVATGKQTAVWPGYGLPVAAMDWAPDGRQVAAALEGYGFVVYSDGRQPDRRLVTDRMAYVWDATTGKDLIHIGPHANHIASVRFSPDGTKLLTASWDKTACVWDATTGKRLHALAGHKTSLLGAVFSADGRRILTLASAKDMASDGGQDPKGLLPPPEPRDQDRPASLFDAGHGNLSSNFAGEAKLVRVWDTGTGAELAALTKKAPGPLVFGHVWYPTSAGFSADGKRIAVAFTDGVAAIWDADAGGDEKLLLEGHQGSVTAVAFSPDGKQVATAGEDHTARIWDAGTGRQLFLLRGHEGPVFAVQFSNSGALLLTRSDDRTARVWDAKTGVERAVLRGHTGEIDDAVFSLDDNLAATAGDSTARVWSLAPPKELALAIPAHKAALTALSFSPDGRQVLTGSKDETAKLFDAETGRELMTIGADRHLGPLRSAAFSMDGRRLVTASEMCRYTKANGEEINTSAVHLWDAITGADAASLKDHKWGAAVAVLSPQGGRLLTVGDGTEHYVSGILSGSTGNGADAGLLRLWDADTQRLVATLPEQMQPDFVPTFSRDGRLFVAAFGYGRPTALFDGTTGAQVRALEEGDQCNDAMATLSPDGRWAATAPRNGPLGEAYLWDAATGCRKARLAPTGAGRVVFACFSPDSRRLAVLAGRNAYIWDADTGNLEAILKGHEASVITATFSPDGDRLLTGSEDRTAALWDPSTGRLLTVFRGQPGPVRFVAFHPQGRRVATASTDGTVRVWPVDLLAEAVKRAPRALTAAERERFEIPDSEGPNKGAAP